MPIPTEAEQAAWWAGYSAGEQAVERLNEDQARRVVYERLPELSPEQMEAFSRSLNMAMLKEVKAVGRLLDWVGVAAITPLSERVLIFCTEYASRTGQVESAQKALRLGRQAMERPE